MATVLELQICQLHPGDYEVRVVKAAAGGEPRVPLSLNVDELMAERRVLEETVPVSAALVRRAVPTSEQAVQRVGRQLFDALFAGPVSGTYRASLSVAQERQERLQIVLRLDPPELRLLPWETLFDPHTDAYVCRQEPMVRHLPTPFTPNPLPVQPPLRILVVVASPRGLPLLDTDAERELLEQALAEQVAVGRVELVWLTDASWTSLQTRLMEGPWHVLHFIGHGDYDMHSNEGLIALVGEGGRAQMIEASRLADLIGEADPAPRLMVLNSCASAQGGVDDGFSSVGAALVRGGISAVAAMQFAVSDQASVSFAQGFYTALAHGRRVDDAVRSGRISMLGSSQSLEWITPVLYVRGEANLLFTLPVSLSRSTPKRQPEESDQHKARLRTLYVMARAELRINHPTKALELLDDLLILDPDNSGAVMLRDQAAKKEQLIKLYDQAAEAAESEDWSTAVDCYEQIMQVDPDYRDTVSRRDFCRDRQRITHLQEELCYHASEGRWQTVLDVSEELHQLDPSAADPDGLSTRAHQEMEHAQHTARLENLYTNARAAEQSEGWSTAVDCYEQIMQVDPDYRDTVSRRDFCRDRQRITDLQEILRYHASDGRWQTVLDISEELRQLDSSAADPDGLSTRAHQEMEHAQHTARLENLYTHARAAEQSEGWSTAVDCYEQIMQVDPDYRDTVSRRDFCRDRQRITDLQEILRYHASDGRWQTVLDISEELRQLDSSAADPDGLSTRAHQEMEQEQTEQLETLYTHARAAELSEDWTAAIAYYGPLTDEGKEYKDSKQRRSLCLEHQEIIQPISSGYDSSAPAKTLEIAAHCGALAWESTSLAVDIWDEPRIRIYDMLGVERLSIKTGKRWGPYVVAFSPDGNRLVSKGRKCAIIWDANTGEKLLHVPVGIEVTAAAFSPDGTCLATGSDTCTYIWDIDTVEKIFWSEQRLVKAVAFSPDGSRLVVADSGGLKVWQPNTALRIFEDHRRFLNTVAYSSDGKRVAAGGDDKKVHLWGSGRARELTHDAPVSTVAFSPNGALLATGSYDHTARIWDAVNADMICNIPHDEMVLSVAFSPYGTRLATGTPHAVTVWTFQ